MYITDIIISNIQVFMAAILDQEMISEHEAESIHKFGKPFTEVHLWLDEFAGTPPFGMRHRKIRHHFAGILEPVGKFGPDSYKAVYQHIVSDLKMEGWTEHDHFPQNEADYIRMGLF